jgi:hypothetical protein
LDSYREGRRTESLRVEMKGRDQKESPGSVAALGVEGACIEQITVTGDGQSQKERRYVEFWARYKRDGA